MNMWRNLLLVLCFATTLEGVLGVGDNFNPPNNSVVTERIGAINITFECDIFLNDDQVATDWYVENLNGEAGIQTVSGVLGSIIVEGGDSTNGTELSGFSATFFNELTFLEFNESLDGVTLYCGTGSRTNIGVFFLRVYREPLLQNLSNPVKFQAGGNLIVNLELNNPAHPFPTFQWYINGVSISNNNSRIIFGYPSLTINNVMLSDSGQYSLTATNYLLDNPSQVLGTGMGEFNLDVLFGPNIERGPEQRAVLVGEPLSLVCGTNLMSNPQPTVMWMDNMGGEVTSGTRLNTFANETLVSLEFANTVSDDTGMWRCSVTVEGTDVTLPGGGINSSVTIGEEIIYVNLTVVVAPGQPRNLTVDTVGGTWISVCWQPPSTSGEPGIARYAIITTNLEDQTNTKASTADNSTQLNVTGLFPLSTYQLRVQAVASALDVGNVLVENIGTASDAATATTESDVPAVICDTADSTSDGGIMIDWRFIHTGGLNITSINVTYILTNDQNNVLRGPDVDVNDTTAFIPSLTAGYSYIAMVIATNSKGSTSVECPQVMLSYGIPQDPQILSVEEFGGGRTRVSVRTLASGIRQGTNLYFTLSYTSINLPNTVTRSNMNITNYVNGDVVSFSIDTLTIGDTYTFSIQAANEFGTSGIITATDMSILITELSTTDMPSPTVSQPSSQAGAIAGGIIGALIALLLITIVVIVVVIFIVPKCVGLQHSYKPAETEMREESKGVKVEVLPGPDIGIDLSNVEESKEIQYAELENFRPSSRQEKPSEPFQFSEPVVYATVDISKKAPTQPESNHPESNPPGDIKAGTSASGV